MQAPEEYSVEHLSLTEVNQAQSFIKFKKRWSARLRNLLYLGIALVLFSGAGNALTNKELNNYWETSQATAKLYAEDYSNDKFLYGYSDWIFGSGFLLGIIFMGSGMFFFWKHNTCCLVENRLRKREIRLRGIEYPLPKPTGKHAPIQHTPLTLEERSEQYPVPDKTRLN